ncbi:Piso0_001443 [Millerozyma farinosa CBS 7064]|uniref:Piso0_001443 protein n=1 Tax=Pichia sorbitophila (strain ATCC MYA-4447 / BCRC 22081 / CBS 7064 / NBRC 10061 / NRRL Y-12695) TaxID=559304 RepID=G8YKT2_PICSO|nr:Piso0_001443 [Millerozyma farinosa CBS 7064]
MGRSTMSMSHTFMHLRSSKYGRAVAENVEYLVFVVLPILLVLVVASIALDIDTLKKGSENFKVVLLSRPFCEANPQECGDLMDPAFGKPGILKKTKFTNYELVYIRHHFVEAFDNTVVWILMSPFFKTIVQKIRRPSDPITFWYNVEEVLRIMLAICNSMLFHTLRGVLMSRMWVFIFIGIFSTIYMSWKTPLDAIDSILGKGNGVI